MQCIFTFRYVFQGVNELSCQVFRKEKDGMGENYVVYVNRI